METLKRGRGCTNKLRILVYKRREEDVIRELYWLSPKDEKGIRLMLPVLLQFGSSFFFLNLH